MGVAYSIGNSLRVAIAIGISFAPFTASAEPLSAKSPDAVHQDKFSWLEPRDGADAQRWVKEQDGRTAAALRNDPRYREFYDEISEAQAIDEKAQVSGGLLPLGATMFKGYIYEVVYTKDHLRGLWRRTTLRSYTAHRPVWRTLVDLNELSKADHQPYATINLFPEKCSPSGKRCIVLLSTGQSFSEGREFDTSAGRFVKGGFELPPGPLVYAWKDENSLLIDREQFAGDPMDRILVTGPRRLAVSSWVRGQPLARAAEIFLTPQDPQGGAALFLIPRLFPAADRGKNVVIYDAMEKSDGNYFGHRYWIVEHGAPKPLMLPRSASINTVIDGQIVFQLSEPWRVNGALWPADAYLSVPVGGALGDSPNIHQIYAPGSHDAITGASATKGALLIQIVHDDRGELWSYEFTPGNWVGRKIDLPPNGMVGPTVMADSYDAAAITDYQSMLQPPTEYVVETDGSVVELQQAPAAFDASQFSFEFHQARSSDGTNVPYFLIRPKAARGAENTPTVLEGYGAYDSPARPAYESGWSTSWLKHGGAYVVAGVRGGGDYGSAWHVVRADRKWTYEDFRAVIRDLFETGVTSPKKLAVLGYSAGGALAGMMVTKYPEMINGAVMEAPAVDLFREDLVVGGRANLDSEWGRLDVPAEREFMEQTSPFQNLRPTDHFPCPLLLTSTPDTQVFPGQVRRFAAKAADLGLPYLFYESAEGGHGLAVTPEEHADLYAMMDTYFTRRLVDPPSESGRSRCE